MALESQQLPVTISGIKALCFDIDDTFSTDGKITEEAFSALWRLKAAGFILLPVTGRPAGWCDHIARFWPVDGVVGENGAFIFFMKDKKLERYDLLMPDEILSAKAKLKNLHSAIIDHFPFAKVASDQAYREYDLAIDICEDVPRWQDKDVENLLSLCHSLGAHAKLSSIHVNAWFGHYTKRSALERLFSDEILPLELPPFNEWIYVGDSPNDEPAFAFFKRSVGVANIAPYLERLVHKPTWITSLKAGDGFAELTKALIS